MKLMLRFSNMVLGYMFICQSSMKGFFYFYFKASKEYTRLSMETAAKTLQIVQFLMPIHVNSAA